MLKSNIYNFDYPQESTPTIEVNLSSVVSGEITVRDPNIEDETTLTGTVYVVTPPSSSSKNWVRSGSDLSSATVLSLSSRPRSDGYRVIEYALDPSAIAGAADGDFYGLTIKLNADNDATVAQAGIEMIIKINNTISGS